MRRTGKILQIAFTYIGTVVGAGFATGQEILQFFTRYGALATLTIIVSSLLFVWLGTKLLLMAHDLQAHSFEDLNVFLFGPKIGEWLSFFMSFVFLAITTVMLAGAGTLFREQFHLPYQVGLLLTVMLCLIVIMRGIGAILTVNSIVVPLMMLFTAVVVAVTLYTPGAQNWLMMTSDYSAKAGWLSPFLYSAFNLTLAQAVLVPIGAEVRDRKALFYGGVLGGIGIGLMLLAGHFSLSAYMPGITQFEIPMGHMVNKLGIGFQLLFSFLIFSEIFTTFIANVFGLALQAEHKFHVKRVKAIGAILLVSYGFSQFGFKPLLSTLYPLFGLVSLVWLVAMMLSSRTFRAGRL